MIEAIGVLLGGLVAYMFVRDPWGIGGLALVIYVCAVAIARSLGEIEARLRR